MSYEEYLALPDEAKIRDWVEGEVIIYMPPIYAHQNIVSFLDGLLRLFVQFFNLGVIIPAPFEVKLWPDGHSRSIGQLESANRYHYAGDSCCNITVKSGLQILQHIKDMMA